MKDKFLLNKSVYEWVLILMIGIGVMLRLINFGANPVSLNRDEAALGYNAFAIAGYGVDEWGEHYPFVFKSFGDYKLPGYIYTLAPIIKVLGVDDWVVRLPSLAAGLVLLYLTYLITKHFSGDYRIALLAAALLALTPWAIFYSRMAWEANVGLMWLGVAIWLMIKPFSKLRILGIGLAYLLAVVTYNTPLILAPVVAIFVWMLPHTTKTKMIYSLIVLIIAGAMTWKLMPLTQQKQNITIFSDPTIAMEQAKRYSQSLNLGQRLVNHKYTNFLAIIGTNTIKSLSPQFLVTNGGSHPWHSLPGRGHQLLIVYLLFVLFVGLVIFRTKKYIKYLPLMVLAFGGLLPALITVDAPHATRSLLFLWLLPVFAAIGTYAFDKLKPAVPVIALVEMVIFTAAYFGGFPHNMPGSWQTGMLEALKGMDGREVVVTNAKGLTEDIMAQQIYIYILLHRQIDPLTYTRSVVMNPADSAGMIRVASFKGYEIINEPDRVPGDAYIIERAETGEYEKK